MDPLCQSSIEYRSDRPAPPRQYAPIKRSTGVLVLAAALALTAAGIPAQTRPKLADYFTEMPVTALDASYAAHTNMRSFDEDLNGDGNQDLIVLGWEHPAFGFTTWEPQPGRVFLGDGNGHFARAPAALFPVGTLQTIGCSPQFADFNADNHKDMFLAKTGHHDGGVHRPRFKSGHRAGGVHRL
jgi:FG-GAP-like repeat